MLADNGKIYCIPVYPQAPVLIINTVTDTIDSSTIPAAQTGGGGYEAGVLANNGKIYAIPYGATNVMIIDPRTDTVNITAITGIDGSDKYRSAVLAGNGNIYCIPWVASDVMIIDPTTNTADRSSMTGLDGDRKWSSAVLAGNGKIYAVPSYAIDVLIIDTTTNTFDRTSIAILPAVHWKWSSCVLGGNGKIYGIPWADPSVLIIDPATNTVDTTTITGLTGECEYCNDGSKWRGAALAPNGKIYAVPGSADDVLIIDPATDTYDRTTISGINGRDQPYDGSYTMPVLAPNGKIYAPAFDTRTTSVLIIDPVRSDHECIAGAGSAADLKRVTDSNTGWKEISTGSVLVAEVEHPISPRLSARYVRLTVDQSSCPVVGVRIFEFQIYGRLALSAGQHYQPPTDAVWIQLGSSFKTEIETEYQWNAYEYTFEAKESAAVLEFFMLPSARKCIYSGLTTVQIDGVELRSVHPPYGPCLIGGSP